MLPFTLLPGEAFGEMTRQGHGEKKGMVESMQASEERARRAKQCRNEAMATLIGAP